MLFFAQPSTNIISLHPQNPNQVAGGCDFVRKTLAAFVPDTVGTVLLVDLHAYDAWPALAALEAD